jgi:hypothetical protein
MPTDLAASIAFLKASGVLMSGLGGARAHRHAHARLDEVHPRAGHDLAVLHQCVDGLRRGHDQIGAGAGLDLGRSFDAGLKAHRDLAAARALEHGGELFHRLAHGGRAGEDDLGGLRTGSRSHHA